MRSWGTTDLTPGNALGSRDLLPGVRDPQTLDLVVGQSLRRGRGGSVRPALEEVNALAEFFLWVKPKKSGRVITHLVVGWERKSSLDRHDAEIELRRPRVGRSARIRGDVACIVGAAEAG